MLSTTAILVALALPWRVSSTQPTTIPATAPAERDPAKTDQLVVEFRQSPKDEADPKPYVVRIFRPAGTANEIAVAIVTGGTMTSGEDYVAPPPVITIPAGQEHIDLNIFGIDDPEAEGVETLEVSAFRIAHPKIPS